MNRLMIAMVLLFLGACSGPSHEVREADKSVGNSSHAVVTPASVRSVDDRRILQAVQREPENWLAHGMDFREQRYSTLAEINRDNVSDLGLAWKKDLESIQGQQATPLVVDGVMFFPGPWNQVYALNAATGEQLWKFDPKIDRARQAKLWVPSSRGVAVYENKVFAATADGWLIAIDANSGEEVWRVDTFTDRDRGYFITGAPRVGGGRVYIGNGGSEHLARGYTSAYDASTGELVWRFWSVPGNPDDPVEHQELEAAMATWDPAGKWWELGGGGNVWNSIVYDAELNQVYLGTGNPAPWVQEFRSPNGGDNLYSTSIIAVDAETGEMNWYYQQVPGDKWDYTATQDMTLADMEVDGIDRKVLLQAPKNGFFYVIDRTNGELLRAHPFATVTWASHIDMDTGRPVGAEAGEYFDEPKVVLPGPLGAHNWQAMSFDEQEGLVYFGLFDLPFLFKADPEARRTGRFIYEGGVGTLTGMDRQLGEVVEQLLFEAEGEHEFPDIRGVIGAFDPLTGKYKWQREMPHFWNGGVLATAGGLVVQGQQSGFVQIYDKEDGSALWEFNAYTSMSAPPVTYKVDGRQYIAIMTGSSATDYEVGALPYPTGTGTYGSHSRMLVFALGGKEVLEEPPRREQIPPEQPLLVKDEAVLTRGAELYYGYCQFCHGSLARSAGGVPDLRAMSDWTRRNFNTIVLEGLYEQVGMGNYSDKLTDSDVEAILGYIMHRANVDRQALLGEDPKND